jgi:hypothetical protein
MRKILGGVLISSLMLAVMPSAALAGDPHAVRHRWEGAAIAAGSVILGAILLDALRGPTYAAPAPIVAPPPPPVVYSLPPKVVYVEPPVVAYPPPPPVVFRTAPVVVHGGWAPLGHAKKWAWKSQARKAGHQKRGWGED